MTIFFIANNCVIYESLEIIVFEYEKKKVNEHSHEVAVRFFEWKR